MQSTLGWLARLTFLGHPITEEERDGRNGREGRRRVSRDDGRHVLQQQSPDADMIFSRRRQLFT